MIVELRDKLKLIFNKYNIDISIDELIQDIEIDTNSLEDVYDTILLKNSFKYKILGSLYNRLYPYDLEVIHKSKLQSGVLIDSNNTGDSSKNVALANMCGPSYNDLVCNTEYVNVNKKFIGFKFDKNVHNHIIEYVKNNDVRISGLLVDVKYDIRLFMRYLESLKIDIEYKYVTDNISNIYIIVNDKNPVISKLVLYEIYKKLKSPKQLHISHITTKDHKILISNNNFIEMFYERYFTKDVSDISFCIREYLDRNGFLIHFSLHTIDIISFILHIDNRKMYSITNVMRLFLKFKFTGHDLYIDRSTYSKTNDNHIVAYIENVKYVTRYPGREILDRLKYLNKVVYDRYYINICTSYYNGINSKTKDASNRSHSFSSNSGCANNKDTQKGNYRHEITHNRKEYSVNTKLTFINYNDYDIVLGKTYIHGSKKITHNIKKEGNIYEYVDKRCHMLYSKSNDVLLVKCKSQLDVQMLYLYLITISNFKYILINTSTGIGTQY